MLYNLLAAAAVVTCSTAPAFAEGHSDGDLLLDGNSDHWDANDWSVIVDGVMGGRSSGYMEYVDSGAALRFWGDINLIGGGFSSLRRVFPQTVDLTPYAGVLIELDAHVGADSSPLGMQIGFRDQSRWEFSAAFAVPRAEAAGTSVEVFLPMNGFDRGAFRGFPCSNGCALDASAIDQVGVYVLFQEGPFDVTIRSVTAVMDPVVPAMPQMALAKPDGVLQLLSSAISSGSSVFNKGYPELCVAIYWSALNTLVAASDGVGKVVKGAVCGGLQETMALPFGDKTDMAWELRSTMDALVNYIRTGNAAWNAKKMKRRASECTGVTSLGNVRPGAFTPIDADPCLGLVGKRACKAERTRCRFKKSRCTSRCLGLRKGKCKKSSACRWDSNECMFADEE